MKKAIVKWILKALAAGCIAFALLCLFCVFYFNVPVHYDNPDGATEYRWEASRFYSRGTEGFALGRTNNDGFNNLRDYVPGEKIDILMMGSSHLEGFNTAQDKNAAAVLNELLAGEKYAYNIGTAGHNLLYCVKHAGAALDRYAPGDFLVVETDTIDFASADMHAAADGTLVDIPSHTGGLLTALQKLPYLRLLYTKYWRTGGEFFGNPDADAALENADAAYAGGMDAMLETLRQACDAHGVQAIVVFHPAVTLQPDGSMQATVNESHRAVFTRLCAEKGILLIDLTEAQFEAYEDQHLLAAGFSNTAPGAGHINAFGHRMIAEAICAAVTGKEG